MNRLTAEIKFCVPYNPTATTTNNKKSNNDNDKNNARSDPQTVEERGPPTNMLGTEPSKLMLPAIVYKRFDVYGYFYNTFESVFVKYIYQIICNCRERTRQVCKIIRRHTFL